MTGSTFSMDKFIQMGCDETVLLFYNTKHNIFYDVDWKEVHYIYELLTPNDLILFKDDYSRNIFVGRDRKTMIEILVNYEDSEYEMEFLSRD